MERSSSPTPSTRNLIRSYTTSSDESAAERIAAARAARERRRLERDRDGQMSGELAQERATPAEVPGFTVHEADSENGEESSFGGAGKGGGHDDDDDDGTTNSSLVPKLRVQPTSDRSYTPSVPSTPSRSEPSGSPSSSSTVPLPPLYPAPPVPAPSSPTTPRRQSFQVAAIPAYRPKSASPVASPSSPSLAATPPPSTTARPTSPAHVALAGGLMERLKARRAANLAAATHQSAHPAPAPAAASEAGSSAAYTPLSEVLPLPPPHEAGTPPTSPSQEPVALESPEPASERRPPTWTTLGATHMPSPSSNVEQAAAEAPYKARRTVSSKVFGRDGEEVDFDFTQLSDVPEQTERSTLSNWRDSIPQHRRHGSISSSGRPASSVFSAPAPLYGTLPKRFSLASSVSSVGRQQADGSFARPSLSRPAVPGPSSWSALPVATSSSSEHSSRALEAPDKRLDATSHILGRGGSTGSIFPASSISSRASSSSSTSSRSFVDSRPPSPPARQPSPTRRVSPEVARRAAQFAQVDGPPPSPTKSVSSRSSSPVKRHVPVREPLPPTPFAAELVATFPSAPTSRSLPQLSTAGAEEHEDPLVGIMRRREERRQAIEAYRAQLAQDPPSRSSDSTPRAAAETSSATPSSPVPSGYLFTPREHIERGPDLDWARRYCVLTSAGFDFRPTDQEPGSRPSRAFAVAECALVDDDSPAELAAAGLRPFVVVLKDGGRQHFACESRGERVKWISALQNAIISSTRDRLRSADAGHKGAPIISFDNQSSSVKSARTLTPPGSRFSATRGTVRSFARSAETSEGRSSPPPWSPRGLGLYSFADDKRRPLVHREPSSRSTSTASSQRSYLPEKPIADRGRYDRDLFGLYSTRSSASTPEVAAARPSSEHSMRSDRSLPPVPPREDLLSGPVKLGHRRVQSELATYSTPADQPPFRPTPTRPTSSTTSSPEKRFEPPFTSSSTSYVSPDEVMALERELRDLGGKVESSVLPKIKRDERYKRVQERLQTLQRRLTIASTLTSSTTSIDKAREFELAEKVDYLLHVVKNTLLDKPQSRVPDPQGEDVLMSRVEARIRDLLVNLDKPTPVSRSSSSASSPSTVRARAEPDNHTVTTRAGIHSPSEHREWQRDLERFKDDAAVPYPSTASSVASPNTVLRERERASRKLQNLSPLSPNTLEPFGSAGSFFGGDGGRMAAARPRDPFAGSGVVESTESGAARQAPQHSSTHLVPAQPSIRSRGEWSRTASAHSVGSWAESDVGKVEQALFRIIDGFERQNGSLAENQHHQERIGHVIGELAKWVAEDRSLRDAQFQELIGAVHGVVDHVAELPQRMLASLGAAEVAAGAQIAQPTVDRAHDGSDDAVGPEHAAEEGVVEDAAAQDGSPKKRVLGLNPLSSFAQLDRKMAAGEAAATVGRVKGPRMPGIRLWGAPEPVADRVNRWGGGAVAAKASADELATEAALSADADAPHAPHGPVVDALKSDEKLGHALQAIADGSGDEVDAGAVSLAVFEILQTLRDLSNKQAQQEAREQAERDKHGGLTLKEMAELEAKRAEIFRLEQETVLNSQRTAKINEMVAALAAKTEKADSLLAQIAKNVEEGKTTTMDPALSDEVKRLLGGVRSGVDEHVKDFRGQLTSEVQRMFKEVGKLRDEKKMLQTDIAELMAFAVKQGGGSSVKAAVAAPPAAPAAAAPSAELPKAGLPSSGFFGPRAMK